MPNENVREIANSYLAEIIKLDPVSATYFGIGEPTDGYGDYSPEGSKAFAALNQKTLTDITGAKESEPLDRVAKVAIAERLNVDIDSFNQEEHLRDLNVIASPMQSIRQVFDMMPRATDDDFALVSNRLSKVENALMQYKVTLKMGLQENKSASVRQALACGMQARAYANEKNGYFANLGQSYRGSNQNLAKELEQNAKSAAVAYLEFANFLENEYASSTKASDYIGADRWALKCRAFNGTQVDPIDTYSWGWDELNRIDQEMAKTAKQILPNASLAQVMDHLETKAGYVIKGEENFLKWNQELLDSTITELNSKHFNIPEPVKKVEAMIAPSGGAAAMYYTPPNADFSRPGRTWYPTMGRDTFPLWTEVSTAYHEGVPGHHLQFGYITFLGEKLNAFSRLLGAISGHLEGWALYAERLMDELGYLEDPVYRLGMLSAQAFRAARIVVDIGLHHQFQIPQNHSFLPSRPWTPDLAVELIHSVSGREREFSVSEVDRYLGWPAQATSYKIGERVWLETREASRRARGSKFSLSDFHQRGFELGFVGLNQLRDELGN